MQPDAAPTHPAQEGRTSRHLGGLAVLALIAVAWIAGLFAAAGTVRWPRGLVYVALVGAVLIAHRTYIARRNPELVLRRRAIGQGTARWDPFWGLIFWLLMLSGPVVAALDVVRSGQPALPAWLWPLGAAAFCGGMALSAWAMGVNPHFEGTVRIQKDRGHQVVDAGPYRRIRHPGYLGLVLWALATPLLLGSRWALVPGAVAAAWVALRAVLEERLLRQELPGYAEYASRVRWRMVPGIW